MNNQNQDHKNVSESPLFKRILTKAEEYLKQPSRVKDLLNDAYQKATEKKDVGTIAGEAFESLMTLGRLIKAAVGGEYHGLPTRTIVGGVAVIIYFLMPIDIIPDWLPVVGFLDDISLLAWFMTSIKGELDKFQAWEGSNQYRNTDTHGSTAQHELTVDTSAHTAKYEDEPAGQYSGSRETKPSSSGLGSSGPGNSPSQGGHGLSTGGAIPPQNATPVTELHGVEGTPISEIDPTATHDAEPTDHGVPSGYGETNVRASTTDSTRVPSSNRDDMDHGGNVR
ncbi:hypothetical protein TH61_08640 [Rufibacter sp. DG15C]|uniref:YkvA family protein n=1 Tax=Rufibacter sp. DG15C TaxID=1379909 RepID=UPI00078BABEE|nr:YkvA family protein [Rufibacter sp. DG15C]AMM51229.1 hypothetical protein TH61_08640 [Rufibacter sp. DG15C]